MLGQLPKIKLLFKRLAKEAAITVDEDQIESLLPIAGAFDHLLEDGSAVITGRSAPLNELRSHDTFLGAAPGPPSAFDWRRQPALCHINRFSSKWPTVGYARRARPEDARE